MSLSFLFLFLVIGTGLLVISFFFRERKIILAAATFLFLVFFVFWRLELARKIPPLENLVNQKVTLTGLISDHPDRRINNTLVTLQTVEPKTKILFATEVFRDLKYGDTVKITGVLKKPQNFQTDLGRIFDYENYLAKRGIYYRMNYPEIEILERGGGNLIKRWLFSARETFEKAILQILPFGQGALFNGIFLGVQGTLPEKLKDDFIRTGLIHIVALSGYNITIVAETILRLLASLSLRKKIILGGLVILLFVIMTGGQPTAVRAGLMAGIALFARFLGRPYAALRALVAAAFLMFLWNPLVIYDPGFILSVLATFGLIYLTPKIKPYFRFVTEKKFGVEWRELIAATIAVQFFVFPYLLYKMGIVSLVAPLANLFILPLIPSLMVFGFFTGLLGIFWRLAALPFGFLSFVSLSFIIFVAETLAKVPYAAVTATAFPLWLMLLLYAAIFLISWLKPLRNFARLLPN